MDNINACKSDTCETVPMADRPIRVDQPFSDIAGGVWKIYTLVWVAFCAILWAAFAKDTEAAINLSVVTFFAFMYFTLPLTLSKQHPPEKQLPSKTVRTFTGPLSTTEAATQILLIPVGSIIFLTLLVTFAVQ